MNLRKLLTGLSAAAFAAGLAFAAPKARAADTQLPDTCYLFAYFHVNGVDGLLFAWSPDGLHFHPLKDGKSFLKPYVGEQKIMRDPCVYHGPDGIYRLVWTTGWAGKTIGYASSKDLIHWSKEKAIPVMANEPKAQNCWAPEVTYDPVHKNYIIFWATTILGRFPKTAYSNKGPTRNHRIYCTTTTDFEHFTPTRLLYNGGFNVIDATMDKAKNGWLMFVKNETLHPKAQKNIRLVHAETPEGPFSKASPPITGHYWAEGPSAIKIGDYWYVYFDKYMLNQYGCVRSKDLVHWEDISDQISFPKNARHGTVLKVPSSVIERLMRVKPEE